MNLDSALELTFAFSKNPSWVEQGSDVHAGRYRNFFMNETSQYISVMINSTNCCPCCVQVVSIRTGNELIDLIQAAGTDYVVAYFYDYLNKRVHRTPQSAWAQLEALLPNQVLSLPWLDSLYTFSINSDTFYNELIHDRT